MDNKIQVGRNERFHSEPNTHDQRNEYQRDRDRILYSYAFRRLAGVTQVVGVAEGHHFHNRLTHSIKVAQISRRITEFLLASQSELANHFQLDPEIAEAAALAHDLGHPPFGHIAEDELCELIDNELGKKQNEGFEGNAQSFRIVTRLALRTTSYYGLNLTRATLGAILKYPWLRNKDKKSKKHKKWGIYKTELTEFNFARKNYDKLDNERSVDAEILDLSDDIAYSIYDLEDFWKVGLIQLGFILKTDSKRADFLNETQDIWWEDDIPPTPEQKSEVYKIAERLFDDIPLEMLEPYIGSTYQRAVARNWCSKMVARYIRFSNITLHDQKNAKRFVIRPDALQEIRILKALTRRYVILNPTIAAQQNGYRNVIRALFMRLLDIVKKKKERKALPYRWQEYLIQEGKDKNKNLSEVIQVRCVADIITEMTEQEAIALLKRLTGFDPGSILNPIIH